MRVHAEEAGNEPFTLAFRIPGWCKGAYKAYALGKEITTDIIGGVKAREENGYLYLTGSWKDGDEIRLEFDMPLRIVSANPKVRENTGKVAFTRGPITYCMEQADNGDNLWEIAVLPEPGDLVEGEIAGVPMTFIDVPAVRIKREETQSLYSDYVPGRVESITARLIPYFAWANRGEGEMRVWIPVVTREV